MKNLQSALTVRKKGYGSTSLYNKSRGERLGVRGPYGNTFEIEEKTKKVMLVGGGTGLVPLLRLTGYLNDAKIDTTMIIGAKTHTEVFFEKLAGRCLADTNHKIVTTTEDGELRNKRKSYRRYAGSDQ